MILNTGSRTDIPACFAEWFYNRVREGYVLVRNPYAPIRVTRYRLDPAVVDCLMFCTKDPAPMLDGLSELDPFRQLWYVTITPYGRKVEPCVPPWEEVVSSFRRLSERLGRKRVIWRYDPIFLSAEYPLELHKDMFDRMAKAMAGYTDWCVISFIDLYEKTRRNFPGVQEVSGWEREEIGRAFAETGKRYKIRIRTCCEGTDLARYGIDCSGCMTQEAIQQACGIRLHVPVRKPAREGCSCLLGSDIGAYDTCGHGCRYCYANHGQEAVRHNRQRHDPTSPFLVGRGRPEDVIKDAEQESWLDGQMCLF